ncbi:MAG: hypothetical protein EO766_16360 [Hydrotalea sp. AMD]|uniref:hypothetical protein n=1 Tax=Hydrotalea sp. AMD TaxID=2501297 RepID=UPI001024C097|nr:hypothetical protein [Hydrotalea sp. AMD]RWZ85639.1 MAG: hypothetical protein EO766_16360 [Hydrotalea sp. AMD]
MTAYEHQIPACLAVIGGLLALLEGDQTCKPSQELQKAVYLMIEVNVLVSCQIDGGPKPSIADILKFRQQFEELRSTLLRKEAAGRGFRIFLNDFLSKIFIPAHTL